MRGETLFNQGAALADLFAQQVRTAAPCDPFADALASTLERLTEAARAKRGAVVAILNIVTAPEAQKDSIHGS